jgi:hypothetical protein
MNEIDFIFIIDPHNRIRVRFVKDKGVVSGLVVQYESLIKELWVAIVRYDNAHGFLHRDELFPDGSQRKTPIDMDMNTGLTYAQFDIKDRWVFYRDRYIQLMREQL